MPDHIVILHSGLSQKVVQIQEKMTTPSSYTPVNQFYQDRAILVTGGTGFMGKVLVEKLLRSCPGIRNIYLLIRPKRGKDVSSRMSDLLQAPLFNNIRKDQPQALNKIIPIPGDIMQPELGISQFDQNILIREVSVVFHSAATVKFDEMLKQSVNINMLGTKRLVQLCHRILGLEALIHVSTAYCNCDRPEVDEVIYSPPYDPEHIIQCMEWMDDDLVNTVTPKLIGNRPNTYTFTKALAESMLMKECGNLPVAIVRPSIVLSSAREPLAGWIDNWNGPSGIIGATSKGIFRTILCDPNKVADLIPVDFVVNLLVCAAWKTATTRREEEKQRGKIPFHEAGRNQTVDPLVINKQGVLEANPICSWSLARSDDIAVYNCCTGLQNPITWKQFVDYSFHHIRRHPLVDTMWYPDGAMHSCSTINTVMASIQNKLSTAAVCLHYFTTQQWIFNDDKVRQLSSMLSVEDKKCFSFDVREIDWPTYIESYILGMRQFLFKEKPSSLPTARKKLRTQLLAHLKILDHRKTAFSANQDLQNFRVISLTPSFKELQEVMIVDEFVIKNKFTLYESGLICLTIEVNDRMALERIEPGRAEMRCHTLASGLQEVWRGAHISRIDGMCGKPPRVYLNRDRILISKVRDASANSALTAVELSPLAVSRKHEAYSQIIQQDPSVLAASGQRTVHASGWLKPWKITYVGDGERRGPTSSTYQVVGSAYLAPIRDIWSGNLHEVPAGQLMLHAEPVKMSHYTPVSQFYQDRAILVTGGTGFMGKVLVEKLLRS
uniref:Fatty acyl-CoA reductase n=1 Tax=Timema douglasi TaxID=61478 RepID=A0A7R8Z4W7_TIMDO|nr:unnamed protein product [Timema douglasi]